MPQRTTPVTDNQDLPGHLRPDFGAWLERSQQEVEGALTSYLGEIEGRIPPHSRLPAAVLYSVKAGGKRLRPILVLEACRTCGGRVPVAIPAALALEFVHTFSLIHDDLPAMDDDELRRGQPTNHKVFGEGLAILAGDWLVTHAFALLVAGRYDGPLAAALVAALAGATEQMIEGQGADLEGEHRPVDGGLVTYIHERKTAALLVAACRMGALCAGASAEVLGGLARYGHHLGVAFQIVDDLLDATGSAQQLGKAVCKDAAATKQTYPAAFGLEGSRLRAREQVEAALLALESFGSQGDRLRDLARYVLRRDH